MLLKALEASGTRPDDVALEDGTRQRTWRELEERATRLAHLLRGELGLRADDSAAVLMGNRVEFIELVLGALFAGIWLTPINRHLQDDEIQYVVDDCGARVLFTDPEHADRSVGDRVDAHLIAGDSLDSAIASASPEPFSGDGPAGGTMVYTSGTTGRPKGVKRARASSIRASLETARRAGHAFGLDGRGPHLVTGPIYHAAPLLLALYDLFNGAPMILMPRWDESEALALMTERRVRHTHLVPTMFVRLLNLPEKQRAAFDPSHLELVLHGAAPVSPHVKRRMIDWWGPVLVEYWGATEGGVNTLATSEEWLEHPGTVGKALPHFEVFAAGDAGQKLAANEVGILFCRHRSLAQVFEYHNDPVKTADAHPEPHVFCIGDMGRVDEEGFVYLSDRKSNMIISGGVNIYPAEVEQALQEHPAVSDVGVFGIPDDEWGESVKAAVELKPGHVASAQLESEILTFARTRLAGFKVPRSIDFEAQLPRYATGKLYVRRLRDRYWKDRDRSI